MCISGEISKFCVYDHNYNSGGGGCYNTTCFVHRFHESEGTFIVMLKTDRQTLFAEFFSNLYKSQG